MNESNHELTVNDPPLSVPKLRRYLIVGGDFSAMATPANPGTSSTNGFKMTLMVLTKTMSVTLGVRRVNSPPAGRSMPVGCAFVCLFGLKMGLRVL